MEKLIKEENKILNAYKDSSINLCKKANDLAMKAEKEKKSFSNCGFQCIKEEGSRNRWVGRKVYEKGQENGSRPEK